MMITSLTIGWLAGFLAAFSAGLTFGFGLTASVVIFMVIGSLGTIAVAACLISRTDALRKRDATAQMPFAPAQTGMRSL